MYTNLPQNQPQLIAHFRTYQLVYIKQYGSGTLRIAADRDSLFQTVPNSGAPIQDGIAQVTADGWKQYFWKGDFWIISDQQGFVVWQFPGNEPYVEREIQSPQLPIPRDILSTYR